MMGLRNHFYGLQFYGLLFISVLLVCTVFGIPHKEKHYSYLQDVLKNLPEDSPPPLTVEPPPLFFRSTLLDPYNYLRPRLILWDPISQRSLNNGIVKCPRCAGAEVFLRTAHWKDGRTARNSPRLLFSHTGVTYLVSRVYRCNRGHEIVAHDDSILRLFPYQAHLPFLLSHISGIMRDLYKTCVLYSQSGLKVEQIECLIAQQHLEYFEERRDMFEEERKLVQQMSSENVNMVPQFPTCLPDELKAPSNDFICQCIIHAYQENEMLYTQCMAQTSANLWISCDHTFKVAANIGLVRKSDNKWQKQYDTMFCILNEAGMVLAWQLTKGTAFDNVRNLLENLKHRFDEQNANVKLCAIDNCCAWRKKLQEVFGPDFLVKLDLFHAIQRTVKCIPKRHPFAFHCCQAFRLIVRDRSDMGEKRTLPTPAPQVIMENINKFLDTWKDISHNNQPVLPASALNEIEKLKVHAREGCLSGIPVGCGSERNENLHKCIRLAASKGRIGVLLAVTLITSFLYRWNEIQKARSSGVKTKIYPPITSRKNELLQSSASLTKEQFGIGVSKLRASCSTLPASYENCSCYSLNEVQDVMSRAFDDDSSCETDTTADEDENDIDFKDIGNAAFEHALNLYYIVKDLPSVISQAVNTNHFHLMGSHALFSFGTMLSECDLNASNRLEELLFNYNFARIPVAPDGDCLFSSIIFQLKQMISSGNSDLVQHLNNIDFNVLQENEKSAICQLRALMVSEMLQNRVNYEGYITNGNIEYEEQATCFKQCGVYSGEIGNVMVLSLANVLRVNMVLFTSMGNFPIIPVTPLRNICTQQTLYLAFNHFGGGHYDPVAETQDGTNSEQNTAPKCKEEADTCSVAKEEKQGCGCGRGAAKKTSSKFCYQEPGGRRTLCPCYRDWKACTELCKCNNCFNTIGKRPEDSNNKRLPRKRNRHGLQSGAKDSLSFMESKNEGLANPAWTNLEHILVEVIVDKFIRHLGEATTENVCKVYNGIVSITESAQEISVPISRKTEPAIRKKIESIKKQAVLFRQFYLSQVENNMQMS